MGYRIAIAGATGNVGTQMLEILAERGFPADEVVPLASRRSVGREVTYGEKSLKVQALVVLVNAATGCCSMSAASTRRWIGSPRLTQPKQSW